MIYKVDFDVILKFIFNSCVLIKIFFIINFALYNKKFQFKKFTIILNTIITILIIFLNQL